MYFNSNKAYTDAIKSKDVGALRALLVGIIGSDPTFATSEYNEARRYIKETSQAIHGEVLRLDEPYVRQEDEYTKSNDEWNEEFFQMQLLWLRYNFATKERLPIIKEIGESVYKNKPTLGKTKKKNKVEQANKEKKEDVVMTTGGGQSKIRLFSKEWFMKNYLWIIAIVAVVAVALFIFKIILK
ncbi:MULTISPECIES: hypothetical protein [unclassified Blautia]|uniref:hypothetical protein n=1 Tax=unclassified Blautia TaxID=2648079 RepID=UPI00302F0EB2|nr:hypothetical protein [Lachnoclostridium sp.]